MRGEGCDYHLEVDGKVLVLTDIKAGRSITNSAEWVVRDLAAMFPDDFDDYRIVYRDTMDRYDGLAHRGAEFIGFVPIQTRYRHVAVTCALTNKDRNGDPWPT